MFARRPAQADAAPAPDQGWGVAQPPSFAPEAAPPQADVAQPPAVAPAPFGAAPEAMPVAAEPSPDAPAVPAPAVAVPDNPAAEFAAAVEEPEPQAGPAFDPSQPLAPVIPINVDGLWVAGRGRGSGGAKAPKEKGAKGLRLKRSNNAAGLEVVGAAAVAETVVDPAAAPVPGAVPADEPKPKRAFGKEIRFGRKKKEEPEAGPEGGFPPAPPTPEGLAPPAPTSDGGFGAVAPPLPPPPTPGFAPAPHPGDSNSGFGTDSGFGGQGGFGAPAPAADGWQEQPPGKKKRGIRLPSSSGKFGRPTLIVLVVIALVAAALGYMFFGRGGAGSQPAYALDLAAGQTYNYKMTMALNGQMTLSGRTIPLEETLNATMSWNVQSVDANEVATVDVRLADPQITMNGKSLPVGELPESSSHYTMRVAKDGSIISGGGGLGALSGGTSSPAGEVPGTDQLTPLLPGHDVQPGDTWAKTFDSDLPYGMGHIHYVTHSTYVKNEDVNGVTTSVIATKLSLPLHMKVDLLKMMKSMGTSTANFPAGSHPVIAYGGHVSGTTTGWFDPNSHELLKTSVEAQFRMTMVFHGLPPGALPGGNTMVFRGGILVNLQKV
jgi:hypothetical protein